MASGELTVEVWTFLAAWCVACQRRSHDFDIRLGHRITLSDKTYENAVESNLPSTDSAHLFASDDAADLEDSFVTFREFFREQLIAHDNFSTLASVVVPQRERW